MDTGDDQVAEKGEEGLIVSMATDRGNACRWIMDYISLAVSMATDP
jgi:hypothetical protein